MWRGSFLAKHPTTEILMRPNLVPLIVLAVASIVVACAEDPGDDEEPTDNVLLAQWSGPHGGVPAFDQVDLADMAPAIEAGTA